VPPHGRSPRSPACAIKYRARKQAAAWLWLGQKKAAGRPEARTYSRTTTTTSTNTARVEWAPPPTRTARENYYHCRPILGSTSRASLFLVGGPPFASVRSYPTVGLVCAKAAHHQALDLSLRCACASVCEKDKRAIYKNSARSREATLVQIAFSVTERRSESYLELFIISTIIQCL
jgi:hypothetical protein